MICRRMSVLVSSGGTRRRLLAAPSRLTFMMTGGHVVYECVPASFVTIPTDVDTCYIIIDGDFPVAGPARRFSSDAFLGGTYKT